MLDFKLPFIPFPFIPGLLADARHLVETARDEASNYRSEYGGPIPIKYLAHRLASYVHAYTLYSAVRPFGCSILLSAWEPQEGEIDDEVA